jgi:hypothetical protein
MGSDSEHVFGPIHQSSDRLDASLKESADMTVTVRRGTASTEGQHDDQSIVSLHPPTKRRPSWVLIGTIVVGLSALLGAYVFETISDTIQVTVAGRDLDPGEAISAEDLRVVEVGRTDEFRAIQPFQQDLIIGLAPLGPIPEGTMLNTGLFVAADSVVPDGKVVVGTSLSAGAVPTPSLGAADKVIILATSPESVGATDTQSQATVLGEATVWSVRGEASTTGESGRVWVALLIDKSQQSEVAQAAADGRLRLALTGS